MTLRFEPDVSLADWWAKRDEPWWELVRLGPSGFPAYAQVPGPWGGLGEGSHPYREYLLFRGPVTELPDWGPWGGGLSVPRPAAGWPDDRAWFLAFDVDPAWLAVGGSGAAVDALVADPRIRALPVEWGPLADPRGELV